MRLIREYIRYVYIYSANENENAPPKKESSIVKRIEEKTYHTHTWTYTNIYLEYCEWHKA